jgi:hypothetical protein
MTGCLSMSSRNVDPHPVEVDGQEYDSPGSIFVTTVSESVAVFPTGADAMKDESAIANKNAPACVKTLESSAMTKGMPSGLTAGKIDIARLVAPRYGDHDAGLTAAVPLIARQHVIITLYVSTIEIQKARSEAVVQFYDFGSQVPPNLLDGMMKKAVSRLTSA